jgi:hypothetical protein
VVGVVFAARTAPARRRGGRVEDPPGLDEDYDAVMAKTPVFLCQGCRS